jgi:hypothetical protein
MCRSQDNDHKKSMPMPAPAVQARPSPGMTADSGQLGNATTTNSSTVQVPL